MSLRFLQEKREVTMSNNKQSIYDTMKSALEQFIEWLEENHPTAVPPPETKEHFFMKEKIDQQMAYNAGFTKAKNLYLDGE